MSQQSRRGKAEAHLHILGAMLIKHYKVLFQSKSTLLTMVLGPLIIVALIGASFNTSETQTLTVGIYSNTSAELVDEISLSLAQNFTIEKVGSEEQCRELIITGVLQVCLVFPNNFDPELSNYNNELIIYADSSQLNLAYIITDQLNTNINLQSEEISTQYVNQLLDAINQINSQLSSSSQTLSSLQTTTSQVSSTLSTATTNAQGKDFTFVPPTFATLGTQVQQLRQLSSQLTTAIITVDNLEEQLATDIQSINYDLTQLEDTYEEGCGVNGTDTDCDQQQEEITLLESEIAELDAYYSVIENNTLSTLSINITTQLSALAPMANSVQTTLDEAGTKLATARLTVASLQSAITSATSATSALTQGLQGVSASATSMKEKIGLIAVTDAETIATPIKATYKELETESTRYITKLFPTILALFIMLVSMLLSATFVIIEKKGSAFIRNHIAPVYSIFFPITILLTLLSIVVAEMIIILFVAQLFFGVNSVAYFGEMFLATLFAGSLFILLGIDIGFLFDTEESVSLASTFLAVLMMLFSPLVFPLQSMTEILARIANINPFVIISDLFRKILLFDAGIALNGYNYLLIGIYIIMFIAMFTVAYAMTVKKY